MRNTRRQVVAARWVLSIGLASLGGVGCAQQPSAEDIGSTTAAAQERVAICHKGETITVARPAVAAHLRHGDTEGACDTGDAGVDAGAAEDAGTVVDAGTAVDAGTVIDAGLELDAGDVAPL